MSRDLAVVIGASGGLGAALADALAADGGFADVVRVSRAGDVRLDLHDESSIERAATRIASMGTIAFVVDATGILHDRDMRPEKSWRQIDPIQMARAFAINATGPALLMKHFLPRLPRRAPAMFATLSARVGSIGDNRAGGWFSYRASKAALNQIVRTAAIELRRSHPQAVCVAVHPGTVDTPLSAPFAKSGLAVRTPADAAADILAVLQGLSAKQSGEFIDYRGNVIPW